jgi:hypothetical protein
LLRAAALDRGMGVPPLSPSSLPERKRYNRDEAKIKTKIYKGYKRRI